MKTTIFSFMAFSLMLLCLTSLESEPCDLSNSTPWDAGYIMSYHAYAQTEAQRTGIPASITMAQAIIESDRGRSRLARKANNHFGIKWWTTKHGRATGRISASEGWFRVYNDPLESYQDHSEFITGNDCYDYTFEICGNNSRCWAYQLKVNGYAEDARYAEKLIWIIRKNNLWQLDGHSTEPMHTNYIAYNF